MNDLIYQHVVSKLKWINVGTSTFPTLKKSETVLFILNCLVKGETGDMGY